MSPYQRHDTDCQPVEPGDLLSRNGYIRHDEECVEDPNQPASTVETDLDGNSYKNWNADYTE